MENEFFIYVQSGKDTLYVNIDENCLYDEIEKATSFDSENDAKLFAADFDSNTDLMYDSIHIGKLVNGELTDIRTLSESMTTNTIDHGDRNASAINVRQGKRTHQVGINSRKPISDEYDFDDQTEVYTSKEANKFGAKTSFAESIETDENGNHICPYCGELMELELIDDPIVDNEVTENYYCKECGYGHYVDEDPCDPCGIDDTIDEEDDFSYDDYIDSLADTKDNEILNKEDKLAFNNDII